MVHRPKRYVVFEGMSETVSDTERLKTLKERRKSQINKKNLNLTLYTIIK